MKVWEDFLGVGGWKSRFSSVDEVLKHYRRKVRSEKTRENFCLTLMLFCKSCGLDPDSLAGLDPGEASRLCQEFTDGMMEKEYSIRYVNVCQAYLKTFFRVNGFEGERRLRLERYHQPARYRKRQEYVPTPSEIYRMALASGSVKNRAIVFALYTAGLRNSTLRALRYKDVKDELQTGIEVVRIPVYPEMKEVDPAACKGNIPYYTFFDSETTKVLRSYIDGRRRRFRNVEDEEPLFCSDSNNVREEMKSITRVSKNGLDRMVKRVAKQAGISQWSDVTPKCLRKAFESALRNNRLDVKDQEFLMGHILPGIQDPYYDSTKIEHLRKKYAKITFFPHLKAPTNELRKKQVLDTVQLLGFSEEKIKKVQEALAKYEKVDEALDEIKKLGSNSYNVKGEREKVRIVRGENGLIRLLNENWLLVKELSNERFVLTKSFN